MFFVLPALPELCSDCSPIATAPPGTLTPMAPALGRALVAPFPCLPPSGVRVSKGGVSLPALLVLEALKPILGFLCEYHPKKIFSKMGVPSTSG